MMKNKKKKCVKETECPVYMMKNKKKCMKKTGVSPPYKFSEFELRIFESLIL